MDLLTDLLDVANSLSVAKIKHVMDSIANNIPGYFLPRPGIKL